MFGRKEYPSRQEREHEWLKSYCQRRGLAAPPEPVKSSGFKTAVHEAAHALVAKVLGIHVHWVTITPDDDYRGACSTQWKTPAGDNERAFFVAGGMAERWAFPGSQPCGMGGEGGDIQFFAKTLSDPNDVNGPLVRAMEKALRIIVKYEVALFELADALMKHKTLTNEQLDEILQPHLSGGIPPESNS